MLLADLLLDIQKVRLAGYDGDFGPAKTLIRNIRNTVDIYASPKLTGELQLVEGLTHQAVGEWGRAIDCFRRAEVLARLACDKDLLGFARSWLAFCKCNVGSRAESAELLVEELPTVSFGHPEARHRFCLVVAELFSFAGQLSVGMLWFEFARRVAASMQSRGLFSSALFNQAAYQAWAYVIGSRIDDLSEMKNFSDPRTLVESSINYDGLTGVAIKPVLHRLLLSQVASAGDKYDEALGLLEGIDYGSDLPEGDVCVRSRVDLEIAWNRVKIGIHDDDVVGLSQLVLRCFHGLVDEDDLAVAHTLLHGLMSRRGDVSVARAHADSARYYIGALKERQMAVLEVLCAARLTDPSRVGFQVGV